MALVVVCHITIVVLHVFDENAICFDLVLVATFCNELVIFLLNITDLCNSLNCIWNISIKCISINLNFVDGYLGVIGFFFLFCLYITRIYKSVVINIGVFGFYFFITVGFYFGELYSEVLVFGAFGVVFGFSRAECY